MIKKEILFVSIFLLGYPFSISYAQSKKQITLENIWSDHTFDSKTIDDIQWMNDGIHYTKEETGHSSYGNTILIHSILTKEIDTLISDKTIQLKNKGEPIYIESHIFSSDESNVLLITNSKAIYRRSRLSDYYVFNRAKKILTFISKNGSASNASFSPDGSKVAYTRDNNLFYFDLFTQKEIRITSNGKHNEIINGSTDWVNEEEFGFTKAYTWSTDSKKILYLSFDERQVKEYSLQFWRNNSYPENYTYKYPKAGEKNSIVHVAIYDCVNAKNQLVDLKLKEDDYIPRFGALQEKAIFFVTKVNRLQNKLELIHIDGNTGTTKKIYQEETNTYIDIENSHQFIYLKDNKNIILTNEENGFNHLYLYTIDGKLVHPITKGDWEIDEIIGIDEKNQVIYYTSTEDSPLERHLYSIDFSGNKKRKVSSEKGTHKIKMNPTCTYYVDSYSRANQPIQFTLRETNTGKMIRVIENNQELVSTLTSYDLSPKEFFEFKNRDEINLHGYMMKPSSFSSSKKYPVLMFVYGGPGRQIVKDEWEEGKKNGDYFWFQMLAQKGYIVVCVDNRGTPGRGKKFKDIIYGQLGKYETEDQIAAAQYLSSLSFINPDRIGIFGWSYGGYMSSLCILVGANTFKMAIAVAPVTNWRWYDSIYTERFLKTPQENASGYDDYSPVEHAEKLKGKFLLVHGMTDDNVHIQHSIELQRALIDANKTFDCFYYPNQNHSIYKRLHLYKMMTDFIEKNL